MKRIIILLVMLAGFLQLQGQELAIKDSLEYDGKDFKSYKEYYIYGDSKSIGNNILSAHESDDFNDPKAVNDEVKMKYVDIDNDPSTFSSSSAKLKLPGNYKKIAYAGLYWTATYSLEKGKRRKDNGNFEYKGEPRQKEDIQNIKFKIPGGEYMDIEGDVFYDGGTNITHAINAPYVCHADVTRILKSQRDLDGEFTVANVKASQGYISGGSAGGWMLYIIYQAPTDYPKYITAYNGFALVNYLPVDIRFTNFKAVDQGDVKMSLTVAALEGDATYVKDECAIIKKTGKGFQSLSNGARFQNNFFNSSITQNSINVTDRTPASKNTLGFDIAQLEVPNYNNEILDNNTMETTLRLKTKADRFYVFFAAFQTEISQDFFNDFMQVAPVATSTNVTVEPEVIRTSQAELKKKKAPWKKPKRQTFASKSFKILNSKKSTKIPGIDGAYYLITNVFGDMTRAKRWENYLIKKGYTPTTFSNPNNRNWKYVAVLVTKSSKEAFTKLQDLRQIYKLRDTWILKANLD